MRKYLVTGGCGFIGSHLADALCAAGHGVRILDDLSTGRLHNAPAAAEVVVAHVADAAQVGRAMLGVDGCFHLAAVASVQRSNEAWMATHAINLGGTICVLDAARAERVPVVFASSAAVYGRQNAHAVDETRSPAPLTAYGADKLGSELHARVAGLVHGVPTLGLRFFNVFGPRQDGRSPYSGVISIFVDRLARGAPLDLYGDGRQARDFVHVSDVVRFLLAGMQKVDVTGPVFNVCTGTPTSIRDLATTIAQICGVRAVMRFHPPRMGDIQWSLGCPERAARHLGLVTSVRLEEGLRNTLQGIAIRPEAA